MRLVVHSGTNQIELAFSWLPTWIGMNEALVREIEASIFPELKGLIINDETLDTAHYLVLQFLEKKFPNVEGLRHYLDAIKHITING